MREPYRTLLDGYGDHWLLAPYLTGEEPDWEGLQSEPRLEALSSGERVLLEVAHWFAGPLHRLDDAHRVRVAQALLLTCSGGTP